MLENSDKKQTRVSKEHNATSPKLSVTSVACRICYESEKVEELVAPCYCKGSVAYVHRSCLDQWLSESGTTNCELCHQMFRREKLAKTNHFRSICHWLKNGPRSPEQGIRTEHHFCGMEQWNA
ncbi:E3 ubiquitin-protein ligase MARCHF2-like isoform X2 [Cylas formicarius]|uniref:E3 ubiquitin-protein ligase MARCHF2-like isoform X2 n=1 Tax=Cylas formicarius TaxID=197179 RepID=UPI0029584671|nr:E3 ubiquitin-protein ligase MARCHF2-like isoform X2 [Cylas formicarius]